MKTLCRRTRFADKIKDGGVFASLVSEANDFTSEQSERLH